MCLTEVTKCNFICHSNLKDKRQYFSNSKMTALIGPYQMKPHSDLIGIIYLQVKDTVTTNTVYNGQGRKDDKQQ